MLSPYLQGYPLTICKGHMYHERSQSPIRWHARQQWHLLGFCTRRCRWHHDGRDQWQHGQASKHVSQSSYQCSLDVGKPAAQCYKRYGRYSQIASLPYTGDQLLSVMSDVVASGAVFVPAIMPTGVKFSDINESVGQQIASVLDQFTSQGVEVWLRFAHEVNYYVLPNTNGAGNAPEYPGGSEQAPICLGFFAWLF